MMQGPDGFIILDAPSLAERTTMRLGGSALAEVRLSPSSNFDSLPGLLSRIGGKVRLLGAGSNLIVRDGKLPVVLVSPSADPSPRVVGETERSVYLWARAGMRLPALIAGASVMGLAGLENLSGIPGTVGGAVSMNAGSFGSSIGPLVRKAQIFSPRLGLMELEGDAFTFSYRKCVLHNHPEWFLLNSVVLELAKGSRPDVRARMREVFRKKQASQPINAWSAGCVFKNPSPEEPAGKLLEQAGFKGKRLGGMVFSSLHANFLVNEGTGTFDQATELIDMARETVRKQSGHALELEVQIWR